MVINAAPATLEVFSKRQIGFESKAQADEKAQHTLEYVSILKRPATQLSDARWGFETTSKHFHEYILPDEMRGVING